jgi:3-methyladenine DNA glycosylase/8-oxoguanine DNA glycosylase
MAAGALGMRDPTDPGTTIKASVAMSAARATTLGSRTSGPTLPQTGLQRVARRPQPIVPSALQRDVGRMNAAARPPDPGTSRTFTVARPVDLRAVLGPLARGSGDPTMRVAAGAAIRATLTPDGPGTVELRAAGPSVEARAWGPGAGWLLDHLPAALGEDDDDGGFEPALHPAIAALARRLGRVRLGRTGAVWEALLPAILEQRITGTEAWRTYRRLVRAYGAPAPGPLGLVLPPEPAIVAALPSWALTGLGIEPRRGLLLRRIAREASRFEALGAGAREPGGGGAGSAELARALRAHQGIGPWTAAEVTLRALGDPDAVSVGDAHLSNVVAFVLTGAPRGTDEHMLELLAPWAGHRARVVRLIERSGTTPPRYGPRVAPRDLVRDFGRDASRDRRR